MMPCVSAWPISSSMYLAVGLDAVGERVAGDLHHPAVDLVDRGGLRDLAGLRRST